MHLSSSDGRGRKTSGRKRARVGQVWSGHSDLTTERSFPLPLFSLPFSLSLAPSLLHFVYHVRKIAFRYRRYDSSDVELFDPRRTLRDHKLLTVTTCSNNSPPVTISDYHHVRVFISRTAAPCRVFIVGKLITRNESERHAVGNRSERVRRVSNYCHAVGEAATDNVLCIFHPRRTEEAEATDQSRLISRLSKSFIARFSLGCLLTRSDMKNFLYFCKLRLASVILSCDVIWM